MLEISDSMSSSSSLYYGLSLSPLSASFFGVVVFFHRRRRLGRSASRECPRRAMTRGRSGPNEKSDRSPHAPTRTNQAKQEPKKVAGLHFAKLFISHLTSSYILIAMAQRDLTLVNEAEPRIE